LFIIFLKIRACGTYVSTSNIETQQRNIVLKLGSFKAVILLQM